MNKFIKVAGGIGAIGLLSLSTMTSMGQDLDRWRIIQGVAVTGANHRLGEPLWELGGVLGRASFAFVWGHNPGQTQPLPLTHLSDHNTVLATGLDPNFLAVLGMTAEDIDPKFVNVPFRDVPVIVDPFDGRREQVPSVLEAPSSAPSRSEPNTPITLGDWLKASGKATIKCHSNARATIRFRLRQLIENGVYTMWGLFGVDTDNDGMEDRIVPSALGGVPNVIVPGPGGKAKVARVLGFCPLNEPGLKFIDITYHSDINVNGATVDLFLPGFAGFAVTNTHVAFPVNVKPIRD